jgi:hypothetical protein
MFPHTLSKLIQFITLNHISNMFPVKINKANVSAGALGVAGTLGGLILGHTTFNKIVPSSLRTGAKSLGINLAMILIGMLVVFSPVHNAFKYAGAAFGAYGATKALNTVAGAVPTVSGLGFALPSSFAKVINTVVPNLGEASDVVYDVSGMEIFDAGHPQIAGEDANYQFIDGADDQDYVEGLAAGDDLYTPDLGSPISNLVAARNRMRQGTKRPIRTVNKCSVNGFEVEVG